MTYMRRYAPLKLLCPSLVKRPCYSLSVARLPLLNHPAYNTCCCAAQHTNYAGLLQKGSFRHTTIRFQTGFLLATGSKNIHVCATRIGCNMLFAHFARSCAAQPPVSVPHVSSTNGGLERP